jgi:hypothetical protein
MQMILQRTALVFLVAVTTTAAHAQCHPAPHSNLGCEFYAITLPNSLVDQSSFNFGVRALNPSSSVTANLQISGGSLVTPLIVPVSPGVAIDQALPWVTLLSSATDTSLVTGAAYHLVSDMPVSVLQLNPDANSAQSSDATLLMPVQNSGTSFFANTWPEWDFFGTDLPAQVGIVATQATTTVQVTAQNLQSGAGLTSTGGSVVMDAGDVLILSSTLTPSVDISGTQISSSAPVVVFAAHAGTFVPSNTGYGDHLEDLLQPTSEIGEDYLLLRPSDPSGGNGAKEYVKLTGTIDNTNLIFDPTPGGAPTSLNAGVSYAFEATADVHIAADHPIVVSQFMEGSSAFVGNINNLGDPSQLTSIPSNRGALAIDFIAPSAFASIYAQVIAPTGAVVTIDSSPVSGWQAIGSSGYSGANVLLCCTDVHHASATQPMTLSVYAYPSSSSTSFWYAAGWGPSDDIFGDGFE